MQAILRRTLYVLLPALVCSFCLFAMYVIWYFIEARTVSFLFLLGFPMIAGAVILHFRPEGSMKGFLKSIIWIFGITVFAMLLSFVSGLEGLICIAMATGPILFGALLGGVLYIVGQRWYHSSQGKVKAVAAPLVLLMAFGSMQAPPAIYTISNTIYIDAAPSDVFALIQDIPDIQPDEVPTHPSHLLGIPKPTAAVWETSDTGTVRHSHWGEGITFLEKITAFEPNKRIAWDFAFPDGWIVEGIQDPHVTVGGEYFNILSGEYTLAPEGTGTTLTLTTRTFDGSRLGAYAEFWHHFFFEDFHEAILTVVKNRAEAS